jgi:hypothetical protein
MPVKQEIPEIWQGTVGFKLQFQTNTSLVDSTDIQLVIKTDTRRLVKQLTTDNITNAANGEVTYVVEATDLTEIGFYELQLFDVTGGINLPSAKTKFKVVETL